MPKYLGNGVATVILSLMLTAVTINWLIHDDPEKELLKPTLLKNSGESIESIDIAFVDQKIFLNVNLRKPITCSKAIEILKIDNFNVRNRTYAPTCSKLSRSLIQIVYTELDKV